MTLKKAIEILQAHLHSTPPFTDYDFCEALRLGVEALKQMEAERTIYGIKRHNLMPGESEE